MNLVSNLMFPVSIKFTNGIYIVTSLEEGMEFEFLEWDSVMEFLKNSSY